MIKELSDANQESRINHMIKELSDANQDSGLTT